MLGGEIQRSSLCVSRANSAKAQCTGKPSYLEPISQSLHIPIERVCRVAEKIGGGVAIGEKTLQNHIENPTQTYLERIRNGMQKPIEGIYLAAAEKIESRVTIGEKHSQNHVKNYNKGGYRQNRAPQSATLNYKKMSKASLKTQFMRIDVVHIANSDVYVSVWIRFWDSLRLSIEQLYIR